MQYLVSPASMVAAEKALLLHIISKQSLLKPASALTVRIRHGHCVRWVMRAYLPYRLPPSCCPLTFGTITVIQTTAYSDSTALDCRAPWPD